MENSFLSRKVFLFWVICTLFSYLCKNSSNPQKAILSGSEKSMPSWALRNWGRVPIYLDLHRLMPSWWSMLISVKAFISFDCVASLEKRKYGTDWNHKGHLLPLNRDLSILKFILSMIANNLSVIAFTFWSAVSDWCIADGPTPFCSRKVYFWHLGHSGGKTSKLIVHYVSTNCANLKTTQVIWPVTHWFCYIQSFMFEREFPLCSVFLVQLTYFLYNLQITVVTLVKLTVSKCYSLVWVWRGWCQITISLPLNSPLCKERSKGLFVSSLDSWLQSSVHAATKLLFPMSGLKLMTEQFQHYQAIHSIKRKRLPLIAMLRPQTFLHVCLQSSIQITWHMVFVVCHWSSVHSVQVCH